MVGGRASSSGSTNINERIFNGEFPEKPGALVNFLEKFGTKWNISLFHYRNIGSAYGNILIGIEDNKKDKVHLPGHVSAALNWNTLRQLHGDKYSIEIVDGMKTIVCKLRPNALKMTSVAYPIDENRIPDWFQELPFDHELMENTIIDKKLDNLIGVLKWDLSDADASEQFQSLFEF